MKRRSHIIHFQTKQFSVSQHSKFMWQSWTLTLFCPHMKHRCLLKSPYFTQSNAKSDRTVRHVSMKTTRRSVNYLSKRCSWALTWNWITCGQQSMEIEKDHKGLGQHLEQRQRTSKGIFLSSRRIHHSYRKKLYKSCSVFNVAGLTVGMMHMTFCRWKQSKQEVGFDDFPPWHRQGRARVGPIHYSKGSGPTHFGIYMHCHFQSPLCPEHPWHPRTTQAALHRLWFNTVPGLETQGAFISTLLHKADPG